MSDRASRQKTISVSVLIPAFNVAGCIEGALKSLQNQSLKDWEAIVVDDASTDSTAELVELLSSRDQRIRLLRHQSNQGAGCARNTALRAAKGKWVAVLDADDVITSNRLEFLTKYGEGFGLDIVADNLLLKDPGLGRVTRTALPLDKETYAFNLEELLRHCLPASGFVYGLLKPIVRRTFIESRKIEYQSFRYGEDFVFYAELLIEGAKGVILSKAMYEYTLPVSEVGVQCSPHSRTQMKTETLVAGNEYLIKKHRGKLSLDNLRWLNRRSSFLRHRDNANLLKVHYWNERYGPFLGLIFKDPFLVKYLTRGIWWRVATKLRCVRA